MSTTPAQTALTQSTRPVIPVAQRTGYVWPVLNSEALDENDLGSLRDKMFKDAQEKGFAMGLQSGEADIAEKTQALIQSVSELDSFRLKLADDDLAAIEALVLKLTKSLLRVELLTNGAALNEVVTQALTQLRTSMTEIVILANPQDLSHLQENAPDGVRFEPMNTLKRGSLVFQSPNRTLEYDPEQALLANLHD